MNGLPLTPNSISVLGSAQLLLTARHDNLARYLDISRGKHQRIVVVSEYWRNNLGQVERARLTEEFLLAVSRQTLSALAHLNQMNVVSLDITVPQKKKNIVLK